MAYNPQNNHRRSIRLKGYDYSQAGLYFITICVKHNLHLFGKIENNEMILNEPGKMLIDWYYELENKYPDKRCHEMVVMPNHFHCIIENVPGDDLLPVTNINLGNPGITSHEGEDGHIGSPLLEKHEKYGMHNKKWHVAVGDAMNWFKTMTTNTYIKGVKNQRWKPFKQKLWQRNYYEHIIRDQKSYDQISNYILTNPQNWKDDRFHQ